MYVTAKDENEKRKQAGQARAAAVNKTAAQKTTAAAPTTKTVTDPQATMPLTGQNNSDDTAYSAVKAQTTAPVSTPAYDASLDNAYMQAISTLQAAQTAAPTYTGTYDGQLKALYDQIVSRDKFSYDINADAMYKQYAQQYQNSGKLAMQDTMGQASALTGGYDSTYGQSVGQQQYDAYLQQLNAVVPELYGQAYQRYQDEGDRMTQQYSLLRDMADDEYSKYKDSYARWIDDRDYAQKLASEAYSGGGKSSGSSKSTGTANYENLLGAVATAKGATSKADYNSKSSTYKESVNAIDDALKSGSITSAQAAALKRVAIPGAR